MAPTASAELRLAGVRGAPEALARLRGRARLLEDLPVSDGFCSARIEGERWILRRDAVGHRSLYWAAPRPGVFVFASTMELLLASGLVERRLDPEIVPSFLAYAYVPGRRSLVRGVEALPAGHELVVDADGVRLRPWWALPEVEARPEEELRRQLRAELEAEVAASLPGGPVGATLSGGIDSSLVLALVRRFHPGPWRAWSVSFGPPHADELAWSGLVCRHLGVEQEVVLVRPEDVRARFDETVGALSQPNGDPLTVPNLLLFERAAAFTGHVFNGEGGDPCFGGPKNAPMLLSELLDDEPRELAYLRAHQRMVDDLPLLWPDGEAAVRRLCAELAPDLALARGYLDALMAVNVLYKGAWHILPKVEHLGLRFGVRPCSPLFAQPIVERAFTLPGRLKRAGSVEKHLLKEAVRDLLPPAILERPKSGMMVPVEAWFSGPLGPWARERVLDGLGGLFPRRPLEDLFAGRRLGLRPRRGIKIWMLLTLESWLRGHGVRAEA